jgi:hypothetical protein
LMFISFFKFSKFVCLLFNPLLNIPPFETNKYNIKMKKKKNYEFKRHHNEKKKKSKPNKYIELHFFI